MRKSQTPPENPEQRPSPGRQPNRGAARGRGGHRTGGLTRLGRAARRWSGAAPRCSGRHAGHHRRKKLVGRGPGIAVDTFGLLPAGSPPSAPAPVPAPARLASRGPLGPSAPGVPAQDRPDADHGYRPAEHSAGRSGRIPTRLLTDGSVRIPGGNAKVPPSPNGEVLHGLLPFLQEGIFCTHSTWYALPGAPHSEPTVSLDGRRTCQACTPARPQLSARKASMWEKTASGSSRTAMWLTSGRSSNRALANAAA